MKGIRPRVNPYLVKLIVEKRDRDRGRVLSDGLDSFQIPAHGVPITRTSLARLGPKAARVRLRGIEANPSKLGRTRRAGPTASPSPCTCRAPWARQTG